MAVRMHSSARSVRGGACSGTVLHHGVPLVTLVPCHRACGSPSATSRRLRWMRCAARRRGRRMRGGCWSEASKVPVGQPVHRALPRRWRRRLPQEERRGAVRVPARIARILRPAWSRACAGHVAGLSAESRKVKIVLKHPECVNAGFAHSDHALRVQW